MKVKAAIIIIVISTCISFSMGYLLRKQLISYMVNSENAEVGRQCLRQCGPNSMVVGFGALNNQLKCECEEVVMTLTRKIKKKNKKLPVKKVKK